MRNQSILHNFDDTVSKSMNNLDWPLCCYCCTSTCVQKPFSSTGLGGFGTVMRGVEVQQYQYLCLV